MYGERLPVKTAPTDAALVQPGSASTWFVEEKQRKALEWEYIRITATGPSPNLDKALGFGCLSQMREQPSYCGFKWVSNVRFRLKDGMTTGTLIVPSGPVFYSFSALANILANTPIA